MKTREDLGQIGGVRLFLDVDPSVDVRVTAEVTDHVGPLDLPDVPDTVTPYILAFKERYVQVLKSTAIDELHGFLHVGLSIRSQNVLKNFADVSPLVFAQIAHANSRQPECLAGQLYSFVALFLA